MKSNTGTTPEYIVKVRNDHTGRWRTQSGWPTLEAAELEAARVFGGCAKAIFKGRKKLHNFLPLRRCDVCGKPLDSGRCTNGRCRDCHRVWCTRGGSTSPGHGRRWPSGNAERAAAAAFGPAPRLVIASPPYSRIGEVSEPMRAVLVQLINCAASHDGESYEEKLRLLAQLINARRELSN